MALVPCSECGKEISDKASVCPHCGIRRKKELGNLKGCLGITAIFSVVFFVVLFVFSFAEPKRNAIDVCKMMLRMESSNSDNVKIDDIDGVRYGEKIIYEWTPLTLKIQNQHGALVGVSAACVFDTKNNEVVKFVPPGIR